MKRKVIPGIDLGTNSVAATIRDAETNRIIDSFVEVIHDDPHSDNVKRRNYRSTRRGIDRKFRKGKRMKNILRKDVCPSFDPKEFSEKANLLKDKVRKRVLDEKITLEEFCSLMYYFSKHRGPHSPRKAKDKKGKDKEIVINSICLLAQKIKKSKARTVGEYLTDLFDEKEMCFGTKSIRNKGDMEQDEVVYISREMIVDEVKKICEKQKEFHSCLTEDVIKKIIKNLFFQRKLKNPKHLRRVCQFENIKVSVKYSMIFEDFKLLQFLRNTRVMHKEDYGVRALTKKEFYLLYEHLSVKGETTFAKARKLIEIPRGFIFNWEEGDKGKGKKMEFNKVASDIVEAIGENKWKKISNEDRETLVNDLRSSTMDEHLIKRLENTNFNKTQIKKLIEVPVETGCCSLSTKAMEKFIPLMKDGYDYPGAIIKAYPKNKFDYAFQLLPPRKFLGPCYNSQIEKICGSIRRIINKIIEKYDVLYCVIEMAREAVKSPKEKDKIHKENLRRFKARQEIKEEIIAKTEIRYPSKNDIDKVLLAKECRWTDLYSGRKITYENLFCPNPDFQDEHTYPLSISMDNSFVNRTLCAAELNAIKNNRTPFHAFGDNKDNYKKIKGRVNRLIDPYNDKPKRDKDKNLIRDEETGELKYRPSPYLSEKKKRFGKKEITKHDLKDFTNRSLANTSYGCCEARRFLVMLFAGDISRIKTVSAPIVAILRNNWVKKDFEMLNEINFKPWKNRDDHRHHAIDAAVTAYANQKIIQVISAQLKRGVDPRKIKVPLPYKGFREDLQQVMDQLIVNHRRKTKSNFSLHEDTILRMKKSPSPEEQIAPSKRVAVSKLTEAMVKKIKDPAVRKAVETFREGSKNKFPHLVDKNGRKRFIKRVQVYEKRNPVKIGSPGKERYVLTGGNRHAEFFFSDSKPYMKVVTNLEAATRVKNKERISDELADLVLFIGSMVEMKIKHSSNDFGERMVFVVRKITGGKTPGITFTMHNDARPAKPSTIPEDKEEDDFRKNYDLSINDLVKAEPVLYYVKKEEIVCVCFKQTANYHL